MTTFTTIPVLAYLSIAETLGFYTEHLGFRQRLLMDDYLIVERDGSEIHFWRCTEAHIAENTSCYIRVPDADALHDEFTARGLALEPPIEREWGMKELYVIDPHGNLLKFGQSA